MALIELMRGPLTLDLGRKRKKCVAGLSCNSSPSRYLQPGTVEHCWVWVRRCRAWKSRVCFPVLYPESGKMPPLPHS